MPFHPENVSYAEARRKIRDGDILLFRSKGFLSQLIRVGGRSEYSHAAMAGWWGDAGREKTRQPEAAGHLSATLQVGR
jgi:hypothetical protein